MGKEKSLEILSDVSKEGFSQSFPEGIANNTLSIVFDALDSSANGLIITDLNDVVFYANKSFLRMFDYTKDEIIGEMSSTLFSTKEIKDLADVISIIDITKEKTEEFVVETKSGSSLIVEIAASNVTSTSGTVVGRMASFIDVTAKKKVEIDRENLIKKLTDALDKIKTLQGILPICSSCKKIRDDKGYWTQVEIYVMEHSGASFSHGICPECVEILYPQYVKRKTEFEH